MKTIKLNFLLGLCILLLAGCNEKECSPTIIEQPQEGLLDKWNWIKTEGGLFPVIITPEISGYTLGIELDEFYYKEFKNDTMLYQLLYDVYKGPESSNGRDTYLSLDNGFLLYTYEIIQDTLILTEVCDDCYKIYYERE